MTVPMQRPTHFCAPAHGLDGETAANDDGSAAAQAGRRPPTERVLRKRGATWLPRRAQKKRRRSQKDPAPRSQKLDYCLPSSTSCTLSLCGSTMATRFSAATNLWPFNFGTCCTTFSGKL